MRKFIAVAVVGLALGGCAQFQAISGAVSLGTASISNPITKAREAQIEAGFDAAIQILLAYRRACIEGHADVHCRANIELVQPYTKLAKNTLLPQLRRFVDANDQVNAIVVFNQLTSLYADMKAVATTAGVNLGSLS